MDIPALRQAESRLSGLTLDLTEAREQLRDLLGGSLLISIHDITAGVTAVHSHLRDVRDDIRREVATDLLTYVDPTSSPASPASVAVTRG